MCIIDNSSIHFSFLQLCILMLQLKMKLHLSQMRGSHFALFALQFCSYLELYFNPFWTLEKVTFTQCGIP